MVAQVQAHLKAGTATAPEPPCAKSADASATPCLIVNPRSFNASRGLAARATALAEAEGAQVVAVDHPAALTAAVEAILARRQQRVIVLAGDGTVQAIVEQLSRLGPGAWIPDLLVLPGGRSNLTSADLLPRERALVTLRRALRRAREQRWDEAVVERSALRVEQAPAAPRYGFFLCGALIDSAIRQCHAYRAEGTGPQRTGPLSTAWWVLGLAGRASVGRSGLVCPDLAIDAGSAGRVQGPMRVLLATTLQHATGFFDPYARRGQGSVRLTAVTRRAPRFWRTLPWLLTRRLPASMDATAGYLSGRCERVQVTGLASYALDGEKFDADPARPLVVTPGPRLRFLAP